MKGLSRGAQLYIWSIILAGVTLTVWNLAQLRLSGHVWNLWLLLAVGWLASLAQVLRVKGATTRPRYNLTWAAYALAFVLWGAPAALWVVLVVHLVEWIWYGNSWFVQGFSIAAYTLSIQAASLVYAWINPGPGVLNLSGALGILAAMAVFTILYHLFYQIYGTLKVRARQRRAEVDAEAGSFYAGRLIIVLPHGLARAGRDDRRLTVARADLDDVRHINPT